MNTRKTALAAALAMTLGGAEAVEAAPIVNYNFLGTFTMYTKAVPCLVVIRPVIRR
jgi:hypothetical protein